MIQEPPEHSSLDASAILPSRKPAESLGPIGSELAAALRTLVEAMPAPLRRPTALARHLSMSRVILSRLLGAIESPDPFEVLQRVPGPESLRGFSAACRGVGVPEERILAAEAAIERFAAVIREEFGTRTSLHAAVSPTRPDLDRRFAVSSRYQVFKGMRSILGVEARTWLNCMIFTPTEDHDDLVSITAIDGPLGMQRLRPDVNLHITCGSVSGVSLGLSSGEMTLAEFYTHEPARVESRREGPQLVHRWVDDRLGRRGAVDMLGITHNAGGSRRYATPERPKGGAAWFPDIPSQCGVFDVLLHDSIFPDATPTLLVYNLGARGRANPLDPSRDTDRVAWPDPIENLGKRFDRFDLDEVPRYSDMVRKVCQGIRVDTGRLRLFRLKIQYPIYGFQYVMTFDAPPKPA